MVAYMTWYLRVCILPTPLQVLTRQLEQVPGDFFTDPLSSGAETAIVCSCSNENYFVLVDDCCITLACALATLVRHSLTPHTHPMHTSSPADSVLHRSLDNILNTLDQVRMRND